MQSRRWLGALLTTRDQDELTWRYVIPIVQTDLEQQVCFFCLESPKGSRPAPSKSRGDDGNATHLHFRRHQPEKCPAGHDDRFPWPPVRFSARCMETKRRFWRAVSDLQPIEANGDGTKLHKVGFRRIESGSLGEAVKLGRRVEWVRWSECFRLSLVISSAASPFSISSLFSP